MSGEEKTIAMLSSMDEINDAVGMIVDRTEDVAVTVGIPFAKAKRPIT